MEKKLFYGTKNVAFSNALLFNKNNESVYLSDTYCTGGYDIANVYVCPHCVQYYNLYKESNTTEETIKKSECTEQNTLGIICSVRGCKNKAHYMADIPVSECELLCRNPIMERAEKLLKEFQKAVEKGEQEEYDFSKYFCEEMRKLYLFKEITFKRMYPRTHKYVSENLVEDCRCNRCGELVLRNPNFLKGSDTNAYPYQCVSCDEDLYEFETHTIKVDLCDRDKVYEKMSVLESALILELDTLS